MFYLIMLFSPSWRLVLSTDQPTLSTCWSGSQLVSNAGADSRFTNWRPKKEIIIHQRCHFIHYFCCCTKHLPDSNLKFTPWLRIRPSLDKIHGSSCTLTKEEGISPRRAADRCFHQSPPQNAGHSYLWNTNTVCFILNQMTHSVSEDVLGSWWIYKNPIEHLQNLFQLPPLALAAALVF